jgi:hypothetical protein
MSINMVALKGICALKANIKPTLFRYVWAWMNTELPRWSVMSVCPKEAPLWELCLYIME